jgi:hypothetical protein
VLLAIAVAGLFKAIDVNFDARLQQPIPARAAPPSARQELCRRGDDDRRLGGFGWLAQAQSYRMAFLASGLAMAVIAAGYLLASARASPGRLRPDHVQGVHRGLAVLRLAGSPALAFVASFCSRHTAMATSLALTAHIQPIAAVARSLIAPRRLAAPASC